MLVLARLYRTALEHLEVHGMPKVTGQRGVQIWVPVAPGYTFDDTRTWVEKVSRAIGHTVPELVSWEWHKDRRGGLARLDYTQNAINKTLVAPFSVRPAAGRAGVGADPWDELDDPELRPDRWTVRTVLERLRDAGDPMAPLVGMQQSCRRSSVWLPGLAWLQGNQAAGEGRSKPTDRKRPARPKPPSIARQVGSVLHGWRRPYPRGGAGQSLPAPSALLWAADGIPCQTETHPHATRRPANGTPNVEHTMPERTTRPV